MSTVIDDNIATVGMFDGVHVGHLALIDHIMERRCGRPLRIVTFTDHPLNIIAPDRAPRLITSPDIKHRLLIDAGADTVDMLNFSAIRNLSADDFIRHLAETGTRTLVMGFNNRLGHDRPEGIDTYQGIARRHGVDVITVPPLYDGDKPASSTRIRQLIADGELDDAVAMLGHPFTISGVVGEGKHIGRTLGYPTANIITCPAQLLPPAGVYAGRTQIDGTLHDVMINIGTRPTVDNSPDTTFEAHIIDLKEIDLYGQRLDIDITARVRDTKRFDSLEALRSQLNLDKLYIKKIHTN